MNVLWIGLSIFAVILTGFFIIMGITKGAFFFLKGKSEGPLRSSWVPVQVYSGDDSLGHPDLQTISELQKKSELNEGTENI
jgi:hypothetical protein